jgi:hypothetical protein
MHFGVAGEHRRAGRRSPLGCLLLVAGCGVFFVSIPRATICDIEFPFKGGTPLSLAHGELFVFPMSRYVVMSLAQKVFVTKDKLGACSNVTSLIGSVRCTDNSPNVAAFADISRLSPIKRHRPT